MPRKRKAGREFQKRAQKLTAEAAIAELLDSMEYPNVDHAALAEFPEAERGALVEEALRRHWARRSAHREPILRERLRSWPVDKWGEVFCERPDLKAALTSEQAADWQAFKARNEFLKGQNRNGTTEAH